MSLYFLSLGQPVLQEGASTDEFGAALAGNADIDGDGLPELVVGAPGAGTLHVYTTTGDGLDTTAVQSLDGEASTDRLGAALVLHDLDGDGYADLVAGAPARSSDAGAVYVYKGTSALLDDSPSRADGGAAGDALGTSLAVGDLDGSGVADILAGAPYTDGAGTDGGAALVFLDGATTATTTWTGTYDDDQFGAAVAVVPDIDGDGDDEAAVGAPSGGLAGRAPGWAYVFTEHDATAADWETYGGRDEDHLGLALLGGDFTGDGYGDLLVGSNGGGSESAVQLFASSAGTLGTVTDGEIDDADTLWLGPAGDIDSDGDDDFFAVYSYTSGDCGETVEVAALVGGDPAGLGGSTGVTNTGPLVAAMLGDIYGSGFPALALSADDGVFVHAGESDGDGIPPDMPVAWGDCDESDGTRNPLAIETDGDGVDSDCDGNDDVSVRADEACPDLDGDLAALLDWVAALEAGEALDNQAVLLAVLEEAHGLGCAELAPSDAASVSTATSAVADCDDPVIEGLSQTRVETWLSLDYSDYECYEESSREATRAATLERDSADTGEPAAISGWVRTGDSSTESGGWVRWQDGTVEPIRAATYERASESWSDEWGRESYEAVLPLAECSVTVSREWEGYGDVQSEIITVTVDGDWLVYENAMSVEIACGYPGPWDQGTRVTRASGSAWYCGAEPCADADADGWPVEFGDCDDADARRYPCAEEDGIDDVDNDCSGSPDRDVDGDGVLEQDDCDDADAATGRPETKYADGDGDGWGAESVDWCPGDTGAVDWDGDCDDTDPLINPDAIEVCDGVDNNCYGDERDDPVDGITMYQDDDDDGYGWQYGATLCPGEAGYIEVTGDCDDRDPAINPAATETYNNGVDENCDGLDSIPGDLAAAVPQPAETPDHSDTRGCLGRLGSFAFLLLPLSSLARRRRP